MRVFHTHYRDNFVGLKSGRNISRNTVLGVVPSVDYMLKNNIKDLYYASFLLGKCCCHGNIVHLTY